MSHILSPFIRGFFTMNLMCYVDVADWDEAPSPALCCPDIVTGQDSTAL